MLSQVEIRNFQSLGHVNLELPRFTVIVGPSSSGKSAFTRAMKTLTCNARGHAFITHGERITTIKATTDAGTVTLKRGRGTEDNEYTTTPADPNSPQRTYTKLGGAVPEEVSAFIGIEAKDPINYAGQFDTPYLLGDSAGEVARVLGALTNVSVIFEAARESNRRKLTHAGTLKTRAADLATIREKAESYKPLKRQLAAIGSAEKNLARAAQIEKDIARLKAAIEITDVADQSITRLKEILETRTPDATQITEAAERLKAYKGTMAEIRTQTQHHTDATAAQQAAESLETQLQQEYTQMLIDAGNCPTCGQGTEHLGHAA